LARIEKVNLVRNTQREGLMRSRSRGVEISQAETVLFLDSHCEVEPGWLEPLLERVQLNPRAIVSPVIENINFETFKVMIKTIIIKFYYLNIPSSGPCKGQVFKRFSYLPKRYLKLF